MRAFTPIFIPALVIEKAVVRNKILPGTNIISSSRGR